jgi:predicted amidohydrolase YtcJ
LKNFGGHGDGLHNVWEQTQGVTMRVIAFAACLLVTAMAIAQDARNTAPDTIFYNGKIITVDPAFSIRQAFAVRDDTYVAVGTNSAVRAMAGRNTRMVDLHGSSVIPGMSDNHDHLFNSVRYMRGVDLLGATSTEEVVRRLRVGMSGFKPGETVFGGLGWRAPLTRANLDQISPTVPIVALRGRRGDAVMNTAALTKAGVTLTTNEFMGKPMPRDASGELTGEMPGWPEGLYLIDLVVPVPTQSEEEQLILGAQQQRLALGITSIRDLANWPFGIRAFQRVYQAGKLQLRVALGFDVPDAENPGKYLREQMVTTGFGDKWLRIHTQGEEPWPPSGISPARYTEFAREMNRLGWRPSVHLMTNASLDIALDAWEAADRDQSIKGKRWVIEHAPNATPAHIKRMAKLGVIISTNMAGYANDYQAAVKSLGQEQADRQTPIREFLDNGLIVLSGSDYNGPNPDTASPNNPWIPLYYYVTRKNKDGRVIGPQEKITRAEALRIATINNAYVTFEENVKGSIESGKLADFVVLSADFLTVPEEQILQLRPLATYVGGKKVFTAPDAKGVY